MSLPTDSQERKDVPLHSGCLAYFPDALAEVARLSQVSNDKHNPGEPLHWSRDKSNDHLDCLSRHLLECGTVDDDSFYHDVKVAWRALANLQLLMESKRTVRMKPGQWIAVDLAKKCDDHGMDAAWARHVGSHGELGKT